LIAIVAINTNALLLHDDGDFDLIAQQTPLRLAHLGA
jgi:predicted nucleic acid-binding protein